jgi:hypothetical protein
MSNDGQVASDRPEQSSATVNSGDQKPVLLPCPTPLAAAVDPTGTGLLPVTLGGDVYSPRKR